jgi:hypothetical protein
VEQRVSVTCTIVEGRDGVRLWLTKESGMMPRCVKPEVCTSCRTELAASQLRKSYVVVRAEYSDGNKAGAAVSIAALSAHTLGIVAREVVPVLNLGWILETVEEDEELSVVFAVTRLGRGVFSSEGSCSCSFALGQVCEECIAAGQQCLRFVSPPRFCKAYETPNNYGFSWWTGVTGAADGRSEDADGAAACWLKCPLSAL